MAMGRIAPPRLEGDAPEDQPEQHSDKRRVEGRKDDRIGEREGGQQTAAAQHKPSLVAIPDRGHRVHRPIALRPDGNPWEQDADAKIEPVHHDIGGDGKGDDKRPDHRQIESCHQPPPTAVRTAGAGVIPAVRMGCSTVGDSAVCGGRAIRRRMYKIPTENTIA